VIGPDPVVDRWVAAARDAVTDRPPFDVHTHIGENDPDGARCRADELIAVLERIDARAAVFPTREPAGYTAANAAVIDACHASGGRLVPFCRLDPWRDPLAAAQRSVDAGARGIKLHPRGEGFSLDHPEVPAIVGFAHERRLPVVVHAGRGVPPLAEPAVELARQNPGARIVLAHAAVVDLAASWRLLASCPNLFVDTSWWNPADLIALFRLVPPGQVLLASDAPYGDPAIALVRTLRCAAEAGLTREQAGAVAGGQLERLLSGDEPLDCGPAPGTAPLTVDPLLDRVASYLGLAFGQLMAGAPPREALELALFACDAQTPSVPAEVFSAVAELIERQRDLLRAAAQPSLSEPTRDRSAFFAPLLLALVAARTPTVLAPLTVPVAEVVR
jgi:predicted TIM-barrel fold metal-dependent hydrolase